MTNPSLQIGDGNWAYKEDNLLGYAISPVNNKFLPREMTFTRASDGTRVNEDGLIENVPWNLVTYSEQFDNAAWTKANVTITANATTSPDGTINADLLYPSSTGVNRECYKAYTYSSGLDYSFSVYAKAGGLNWVFIGTDVAGGGKGAWFNLSTGVVGTQKSGYTATIENTGNGYYRCIVTYNQSVASNYYTVVLTDADNSFSVTKNGTDGIYAWGAQLNQGSLKPYFPTTNRQDVPRIDYSSGTGALLLEPQRTNLALYSEQFDNAAWGKTRLNTTGTPAWVNVAVSPNGTTTAEKLMPTTDNNSHFISFTATKTASAYSQSVYAKAGEYSVLQINNQDDVSFANFNLSTGVVGTVSGYTASITPVGNGWYRCEATKTYIANTSDIRFAIVTSPTSIRLENFAGNGSDGIYIWGAQIEAGSYPTSYIPTTSAAVTRVVDSCYRTGISEYIGQTEGTVFVDFNLNNLGLSAVRRIFALTDGTLNNRITALINTIDRVEFFVRNTSGTLFLGTYNTTLTIKGNYKFAFAYKDGDYSAYLNGVEIISGAGTAGTIPACSRFDLGNQLGLADLYEPVNQAFLFKTRLTNAELAAITSL